MPFRPSLSDHRCRFVSRDAARCRVSPELRSIIGAHIAGWRHPMAPCENLDRFPVFSRHLIRTMWLSSTGHRVRGCRLVRDGGRPRSFPGKVQPMPSTPLFSTYSQGENRVTASMLAASSASGCPWPRRSWPGPWASPPWRVGRSAPRRAWPWELPVRRGGPGTHGWPLIVTSRACPDSSVVLHPLSRTNLSCAARRPGWGGRMDEPNANVRPHQDKRGWIFVEIEGERMASLNLGATIST